MFISKELYNIRLRDERWDILRRRLKEKSSYCCAKCKKKFSFSEYLTAHHKYYIEDRDPWDYPDEAFDVLCLKCHGLIVHSNIPKKVNLHKHEMSLKKFIVTDHYNTDKYYPTSFVPYNKFFGIVYYGIIINCGYTTKCGRFDYELIVREMNNGDNSYTRFRQKRQPDDGFRNILKIEDFI